MRTEDILQHSTLPPAAAFQLCYKTKRKPWFMGWLGTGYHRQVRSVCQMYSQVKRLESGLRSQQSLLQRTRCCRSAGEGSYLLSQEECLGLCSRYPSVPVAGVAQAPGHQGSPCTAGDGAGAPGGGVMFAPCAPSKTLTDGLEQDARTTHHTSLFFSFSLCYNPLMN